MGVLRIRRAFRNAMTPELIQVSFEVTGIFSRELNGADRSKIIGKCRTIFTESQVSAIYDRIPQLTRLLSKQGELFF